MRNRSKPSQVARTGFEFERIAVTRGYPVATAHQHERTTLAVSARKPAKGKTPKGGTK
jgi:hypothetical protein